MTSLLLFHSALGLRPAVHTFADQLRRHGHTVHTPDLYEGATFDDLTEGAAERDRLGIPLLLERAQAAAAELPTDLAYAGFSMGTAPAEVLATTRPGARGLVLMHGALPPAALGLEAWPAALPVQVHTSPDDPWSDSGSVAGLLAAVPSALLEHHEYGGEAHLFADHELSGYDRIRTAAMLERVVAFLARLDAGVPAIAGVAR